MIYVVNQTNAHLSHLSLKDWQKLGVSHYYHHLFKLLDRPGKVLETLSLEALFPKEDFRFLDIRPTADAKFKNADELYVYKSQVDGRKIELSITDIKNWLTKLPFDLVILNEAQKNLLNLKERYVVLTEDELLPSGFSLLDKAQNDANSGILYRVDAKNVDLADDSYRLDTKPVMENCACDTCSQYTLAYLYHLSRHTSALSQRLQQYHNIAFMMAKRL